MGYRLEMLKLPRLHLFELHEQQWFPSYCRKMFQACLGKSQSAIGAYDHAAPLVAELMRETGSDELLDLCSGSGQVALEMRRTLAASTEHPIRITLSDLFPNEEELQKAKLADPAGVDFYPEPVDAFHPPLDAPRVRSIFAAFHHFRPDDARRILQDAARNADGIVILESTRRSWLGLVMSLPLPIPAAVLGGFCLRPWSPLHLLWAVFIPVIPIAALWDGIVSILRTYSVEELESMVSELDAPDFTWDIGTLPMARSPMRTIYLIGRRNPSQLKET